MKLPIIILLLPFFIMEAQIKQKENESNLITFCNPVNISYRFCLEAPSRREAADPTVV